jgi:hypothetical protein
MSDADEILESLEKEVSHICYHEPSSPVEQRLANALACLIAVLRKERTPSPAEAFHSFTVGDRVTHMNGDAGEVFEIKQDGAVCVLYDRENKSWKGEYDAFWFRLHPNGLKLTA